MRKIGNDVQVGKLQQTGVEQQPDLNSLMMSALKSSDKIPGIKGLSAETAAQMVEALSQTFGDPNATLGDLQKQLADAGKPIEKSGLSAAKDEPKFKQIFDEQVMPKSAALRADPDKALIKETQSSFSAVLETMPKSDPMNKLLGEGLRQSSWADSPKEAGAALANTAQTVNWHLENDARGPEGARQLLEDLAKPILDELDNKPGMFGGKQSRAICAQAETYLQAALKMLPKTHPASKAIGKGLIDSTMTENSHSKQQGYASAIRNGLASL